MLAAFIIGALAGVLAVLALCAIVASADGGDEDAQ